MIDENIRVAFTISKETKEQIDIVANLKKMNKGELADEYLKTGLEKDKALLKEYFKNRIEKDKQIIDKLED